MTNILSIITAVHLSALSQVESGDNDAAIGQAGEISRFQFMPAAARREVAANPTLRGRTFAAGWERDVTITRTIAAGIWRDRVDTFQLAYRRNPTLPELYLCWHRPARVLNPTRIEAGRAERFANVVQRLQSDGLKLNQLSAKAIRKTVFAK